MTSQKRKGSKRKGKEEGGRERERKKEKRRKGGKDYKNVVLIATYKLLRSFYIICQTVSLTVQSLIQCSESPCEINTILQVKN